MLWIQKYNLYHCSLIYIVAFLCISFYAYKEKQNKNFSLRYFPGKYFWKCFTCSTIDASLPSANPWLSSLVITALPNFMTRRRAYFSWLLSENVDFSPSVLLSLRLTWKEYGKFLHKLCKIYFVITKISNKKLKEAIALSLRFTYTKN